MNTKYSLALRISTLFAMMLICPKSLKAQNSPESERLEKLERAVEQLQERNAELEREVSTLRKQSEPAPAEGPTRMQKTYDGKTYVEKEVPAEKTVADKWKLSTPITELELFGDIRLRYEYRGGQTDDDSPVARPAAGVAGHDDWQERDRERYRLRLGLRGTLLDDWFFGIRLETNASERSTNVTFGDDTSTTSPGGGGPFAKGSDGIDVGQAYIGYKGFRDITLTGGKMPNPLISTFMVWDPDIDPEGLAEQWKHTFNIGTKDGDAPQVYAKDGKNVAPLASKPEPLITLDLFATFAQFVYDDSNPENPLGLRATTTANGGHQLVPNTDAFLLAWQVGAKLNFPNSIYFQFAPTIYNYTGNGDTFNVHFQGGDPNLTNAASLAQNQTGINSLLVFDVPMELGWKIDHLPMRLFGDFAVNLEADDRAKAAGHPGHGDQRYAYQIGAGIGQLKKKHDWQLNVFWQRQDQYSLDPNLVDTEFWDSKLNLQGIGVNAGYMLSDAVWVNFTYGYAWRADNALGTAGFGDIAINPMDNYQLFQADLNIKF